MGRCVRTVTASSRNFPRSQVLGSLTESIFSNIHFIIVKNSFSNCLTVSVVFAEIPFGHLTCEISLGNCTLYHPIFGDMILLRMMHLLIVAFELVIYFPFFLL